MVSDTVRMGEGFGAGGNRTGGRISRIMMVQVRPHGTDVLQCSAAEGTPVTMLPMVLPQQSLLPEVRLAPLVFAGRRDRCGGRGGRLIN